MSLIVLETCIVARSRTCTDRFEPAVRASGLRKELIHENDWMDCDEEVNDVTSLYLLLFLKRSRSFSVLSRSLYL